LILPNRIWQVYHSSAILAWKGGKGTSKQRPPQHTISSHHSTLTPEVHTRRTSPGSSRVQEDCVFLTFSRLLFLRISGEVDLVIIILLVQPLRIPRNTCIVPTSPFTQAQASDGREALNPIPYHLRVATCQPGSQALHTSLRSKETAHIPLPAQPCLILNDVDSVCALMVETSRPTANVYIANVSLGV
jgi:hypothetical protein